LPDPPRLTVAIPSYNGARHLRETLAGIRDQRGFDFDLLVSDDRSEDDTLAIVRDEVGDLARIAVNSERLGLAGNWNRSVELCRTEWVALFHQDDLMRPGHLAAQSQAIASHPDPGVGLVAGPVEMIDGQGRPVPPSIVDPGGLVHPAGAPVVSGPGDWLRALMVANPLRCSAVTTRKAAHQAIGGYDPSFYYAVDWDYWVRMARRWGLIWRPGPPTVAIRWHPASETHRFQTGTIDLDEQARLLDELFRRDGANLTEARSLRSRADRRLARAFLNRAHVALKGGEAHLARRCLARSIGLSPAILGAIALDPRLAAQMAALAVAPELAVRWLSRR
jgi:glycosyltransferase involved in cell wall biosynthesis